MREFYTKLARFYVLAATISLMTLSMLLFALAGLEAIVGLFSSDPVEAVLDGIGLLIIGFAVVETAQFIAEEEFVRRRELRSPTESRASLTKFVTLIVIAGSLEALVMVFKSSRAEISDVIYPAVLFAASMLALLCLGGYQWLSSRIEPQTPEQRKEAERQKDL